MKRSQPLAHLYAQTAQRRFFRLTYSNTGPEDEPKLFQGRDGIAFNEVSAALIAHGYEYGTTIHFYPDDERRLAEFPPLRADGLCPWSAKTIASSDAPLRGLRTGKRARQRYEPG
jgi:hypothetical protein